MDFIVSIKPVPITDKLRPSFYNAAGTSLSRTQKPDHLGLEEWQRILRKQYGAEQKYRLENLGGHPLFTEFRLHNPESGKTYKIAIRGSEPLDNYCSCPDYAVTGLGTCKHIEFALSRLMKRKGAGKAFREGYTPSFSEIHLRYGLRRQAAFRPGTGAPPAPSGENPIERLLESMVDRDEETGRSCLKIPLPEKEAVTNLFSALGAMVASAMETKTARPR